MNVEELNKKLTADVRQPLVTIIVAVFNGAKTITRCINSVIEQNYANTELIIMDGGSIDGTVEILKNWECNIRYWETKPDRGIYHAWNKALAHVHGEWICFLGADDFFWDANVLTRMVPYLLDARDKDLRFVYGRTAFVLPGSCKIAFEKGESWEKAKNALTKYMPICHPGSFHHKDLFEEHGRFDERFLIAGDYDFLLRELMARNAYYVPDIKVAGMQLGGISCSADTQLRHSCEVMMALRNNGITAFSYVAWWWKIQAIAYLSLKGLFGERGIRIIVDFYRTILGRPKVW